MKTRHSRIVMAVVPLVAGALLFVFAFYQRNRFMGDTEKRFQVERQSSELLRRLQDSLEPTKERLAAADDTPDEESEFLRDLRALAIESRVRISRWAGQNRFDPTQPPAEPRAGVGPLPKGVTEVTGTLEVTGPYRSVLSFLHRVENGPRLFNLSDVNWGRPVTGQDVRLTVHISRYVIPSEAPPKPQEEPHDAATGRRIDGSVDPGSA